VAYAKANPGKLNYGSAGPGSASHLGCILLGKAIGADLQHVPYKGTGPAMQDLQAGRLDISCEIVVTAVPQVQAGTLKAFATLSKDRSPVLPDLPTAFERGFQNIQVYTWTALLFPKGTPEPIVAKMRDAALKTLADPEVRRQLQTLGASIVPSDRTTPAYLQKFIADEIDKWAGPIRDSGAVIQ
jgi:tripartite-type tricarboxylate transporter receptor subunit TctC